MKRSRSHHPNKVQVLSTSLPSSKSIPIPRSNHNDKGLLNTYSQIDLEHASKVAEWQESQMYYRLLNGMFLKSQRLGHHPKIIRSLENLIQTQASPVVEASTATSDKQNESWLTCSRCSGEGDQPEEKTKGKRIAVSPDCCFCSSIRTHTSPYSDPRWDHSLKGSSLASGTTLNGGDEEDEGLIFDFEI